MKFTEFFWDFDGTLFDTYPRIDRAIQKTLKSLGAEVSIAEIDRVAKRQLADALRAFAPAGMEEIALERYYEYAEDEGYDTMPPFAGAQRLLRSICEHGGRNYLYTHRDHTGLDALAHFHLQQYFTDAVTREDGFPRKPAPDALLHLMEKHHLSPAACVMLGDRDIDLQAGLNAGMSGALFDPQHYYDSFDTPYRYTSLDALMIDLVWENRAEDLRISDLLSLQAMQHESHPDWGKAVPENAAGKLLWLTGELGEVIDVVKKVQPQHLAVPGLARAQLVEEMSDVLMYFGDVLSCYGISAEEFSQAYFDKTMRNLHRDFAAEHKERYGE